MRGHPYLRAAVLVFLATSMTGNLAAEELGALRLRAERGQPEAQLLLANALADGKKVRKDYRQAHYWYRRAAEAGSLEAQVKAAVFYTGVSGIPEDYEEAFKWFKRAAEQGDDGSQLFLGDVYMGHYKKKGLKIARNVGLALHWYRVSAGSGHAWAQFNLGAIYARGQGVLQNYIRAHAWLSLAILNFDRSPVFGGPNKEAILLRDSVASSMSGPQLVEAQMLAQRCLQSKYNDC